MKIKGISVFERNIEKVVFAIFFLALLGVFGAQFFVPSTVKVGGKEVAPSNAGEIAASNAQRKISELESQSVHADVPASVPDLMDLYTQAAASGIAQEQILAFGSSPLKIEGGSTIVQDDNPIDIPDGQQFAQFKPAAAAQPIVMAMGGTLDPNFVADYEQADPGFKDRLGLDSQPYDARGISLETSINTQSIRAQLAALPKTWWDRRVELLDIEVIRQQQLHDGTWSSAAIISKSPGQRTLAHEAQNTDFSPADLRQLLDEELEIRAEIRNPRTMPTIAGEQWIPPTMAIEQEAELSEITPEDRQIQRLMSQLEGTRKEIDRMRDLMDRSAQAPAVVPVYFAQGGRGGGGGVGGGRGGGREGDGGGGLDAEAAERERQQKILARQQLKLEGLLERETKIIEQIETLGGNPDGAPQVEPINPEDFLQPVDSLTSTTRDKMTIWAHDFNAQPGTTYRYAVRYWATNPYFGNAGALEADQRALAESVAVASEQSPWTEPVVFAPDVQYFVASARLPQRGQFGASASAEFEVFQFFYGYWRRGLVRVGAGEPILAQFELPEGLVIFEQDENNPGAEPVQVEVDPLAARKSVNAYLMDVLAGVAGEADETALIANANGVVIARSPEYDASSPARERLAASAQVGLSAGAAALDPARTPRTDERDAARESDRGGSSGPGDMGRERR